MTTLADLDIPHLETWIYREEVAQDIITPGLAERFAATFGDWVLSEGDAVPPGLHWCLAPPAVPEGGLGPDGHPKRGGFLPPCRSRIGCGRVERSRSTRRSASATR